jgi:uncharacterized protein YjaZ
MKQTWNIQPTYLKVRDYLKAIVGVTDYDCKKGLFNQLIDPEHVCFSGLQHPPFELLRGLLFNPFEDDLEDWLPSYLDDIQGSGVESLITQSLTRCHSFIAGPPGVVWILPGPRPSPTDSQKSSGANRVIGDATPQGMRLYISPIDGWQDWVKPVVAHEYNHYLRLQGGEEKKTLLDHLILEGIAETFAREIFPRPATPWTEQGFVTEEEACRVWKAMYPVHGASDARVIDKHMRGQDSYYCRFLPCEKRETIGHTIGHRIVQDYAKQKYAGQGIDWAELTRLSSEVILGGSHFAVVG